MAFRRRVLSAQRGLCLHRASHIHTPPLVQALRETDIAEAPAFTACWSTQLPRDAATKLVTLSSAEPVQRAGQAAEALSRALTYHLAFRFVMQPRRTCDSDARNTFSRRTATCYTDPQLRDMHTDTRQHKDSSLADSQPAAPQSIAAYAAAYRAGSSSPLQVAQRIIAEVDAGAGWIPPQRYFDGWDPSNILQQAEDSAARCECRIWWSKSGLRAAACALCFTAWRCNQVQGCPLSMRCSRFRDGKPRSALEGVPFCVKDCLHAEPFTSACGSTCVRPSPSTEIMLASHSRKQSCKCSEQQQQ